MNGESFYRRPLPAAQIAFSSAEGRAIFRDALAEGNMEGFFPLAEQFHTQSEPAFCGLGTLVVALNALGVDPGRLWKGPWRWYGEEMLDCCASLDTVKERGVTLDELACLARCNGARATVSRASESTVEALRETLRTVASGRAQGVVVAAYSRRPLGQTGDGHFSPIAGFHAARDLALVLDVARFKYPPHWVPLGSLYDAMYPVDEATGRGRGWIHLERGSAALTCAFRLTAPRGSWEATVRALADALPGVSPDESLPRFALSLLRELPPTFTAAIEVQTDSETRAVDALHRARIEAILDAVRAAPIHAVAREALAAGEVPWAARYPWAVELAAVLLLVLPDAWLPAGGARAGLDALRAEPLPAVLADEVATLRAQLDTLRSHFCCDPPGRSRSARA